MPQLISHWDGVGWQTPNTADILEKKPTSDATQTGTLRTLATSLVHKFAELGAPVRLKDVDGYTSHARYHLIPDKIGAMGNQRTVTKEDLQKVLPAVLNEINAQAAQLVSLNGDESITLFLRTANHRPLGLYELLDQRPFLDCSNYTATVLGADLAQNVMLHDFSQHPNLLIIGASNARLHLQLSTVATLTLFNSPSYLRLAMVGDETSMLRHLNGSPHILGNIVTSTTGLRRLLEGMIKHLSGRKTLLEDQKADTLDAFNRMALSRKDLKPLPRLFLMIDAVSLSDWRTSQESWLVPLHQLASKGAEVGIHVILSLPTQDSFQLPERLNPEFTRRVIMRSAMSPAEQDPSIPLIFVDGFLKSPESSKPMPLEMAAIAETELMKLVTYWQNMRNWRNTDMETKGQPTSTGNTGLLTLRNDMLPPPITSEDVEAAPVTPIIPDRIVAAAESLAAYLGWLSAGPLRDVLSMSDAEALETLNILRKLDVLESGEGPTFRFKRLADPPTEK